MFISCPTLKAKPWWIHCTDAENPNFSCVQLPCAPRALILKKTKQKTKKNSFCNFHQTHYPQYKWKTASSMTSGKHKHLVILYGLVNAPLSFQTFHEKCSQHVGKCITIYSHNPFAITIAWPPSCLWLLITTCLFGLFTQEASSQNSKPAPTFPCVHLMTVIKMYGPRLEDVHKFFTVGLLKAGKKYDYLKEMSQWNDILVAYSMNLYLRITVDVRKSINLTFMRPVMTARSIRCQV